MASSLYMMVANATPAAVCGWQRRKVTDVAEYLPEASPKGSVTSESWTRWTQPYRRLVESEVSEAIAQALDEAPGSTVYRAWVKKDEKDDNIWYFNHDGKFLGAAGKKVSGTVIVVSLGDSDDFCRLGVIENNERVKLSHTIKEHAVPTDDKSCEVPIKFKVLTSIVSQNRQHCACFVDAPPYAAQLMGMPCAPVVVQYKAAPKNSHFNADQEKAVQYWIGEKGSVPPFMLLQGPPGTGMLLSRRFLTPHHTIPYHTLPQAKPRRPLRYCAAPSPRKGPTSA